MNQRALEIAWYVAVLATWLNLWVSLVGVSVQEARRKGERFSFVRLATFLGIWIPTTAVFVTFLTTKMLL
jgi:uncharacterized membrane protein